MNPFDWHGPAFLGFYLLLTLAVSAGIYYLCAGAAGAISVAMVSLLERGHLTTNDGMLISVAAKETRLPQLERTIVDYFQAQGWPKAAIADEELRLATAEQAQSLAEKGLLPDQRHRAQLTWAALGILNSVAVLKVMLAWSRGRQNLGFLIMLWLVAVVVVTVVLMFSSQQSEGGKSALAALRELFGSRFQQSLSILPRNDLNEFIMLSAIFGVADVPSRALGPPVASPGSASGGCSSTGCGGGGGGCGGGNCGGCGS